MLRGLVVSRLDAGRVTVSLMLVRRRGLGQRVRRRSDPLPPGTGSGRDIVSANGSLSGWSGVDMRPW